MPLSRKDLEARYELFQEFALEDQRRYYKATAKRYNNAAGQVNLLRAVLALMTGFAAALATLLISTNPACATTEVPPECVTLNWVTSALAIGAIILPAIGALFGTLADLYQWDRLVKIYDEAVLNIEIADAQSPDTEITDDVLYRAAFLAYTEGTLSVMNDESAQWGQAIRTPAQVEAFLAQANARAQQVSKMEKDGKPPSDTQTTSTEHPAG